MRKQVVNIPSFVVRLDSQKHIDFSLRSPYGGGRPGRVKRKNAKKAQGGAGGADDEEDKSGSQVNLVEPEPETSMGKYLKNLHKTNPDSVLNELPTCCITLPDAIYRSLFK